MRSLFKIKIQFFWNTTLPLCITESQRFGTTQCSHLQGPIAEATKSRIRLPTDAMLRYPELHRCNSPKTREIQDSFCLSRPPGYSHCNSKHICSNDSSVQFVRMTQNRDMKNTRSSTFSSIHTSYPRHTENFRPPPPLPLQPPCRPVAPRRIDGRASRNVIQLPALSVDGAQQMENTSNLKTLY
jgi:hypothetical protein